MVLAHLRFQHLKDQFVSIKYSGNVCTREIISVFIERFCIFTGNIFCLIDMKDLQETFTRNIFY